MTTEPELEPDDDFDALGWWCIAGTELLGLLRRCHAGEDPDLVYTEAYANSDSSYPGEN